MLRRYCPLTSVLLAACLLAAGCSSSPQAADDAAGEKKPPTDPAKMFVGDADSKGIWDRITSVETLDEAQQQKLFEDTVAYLKSGEVTEERLNLAIIVAQVLHEQDRQQLGEAYQRIAEVAVKTDDPDLEGRVNYLAGTARQLLLIGKPVEIDGETVDGEPLDWSEYRGKVVLIDFWATWCGACIEELPNLKAAYNKFHDRGFEVVGITADNDPEVVRKYLGKKKLPWLNLFSTNSAGHPMYLKYGVLATPTVFLIDQQGVVVSLNARGEELERQLAELLGAADGDEPASAAPGGDEASDPPSAAPEAGKGGEAEGEADENPQSAAGEPSAALPVITNSIGMKLTRIPPGRFRMGASRSDPDAEARELPAHDVEITRPFWLGVYEVTREEYFAVTFRDPSATAGSDASRSDIAGADTRRFPVDHISWLAAVDFCNRLSVREGLEMCYLIDGDEVELLSGNGYRLPTEAEWEYACRAGSTSRWHCGDEAARLEDYAWFNHKRPSPVGLKKPNAFGLYDMHGNVWEKCQDRFQADYYAGSPTTDPPGPASGKHRMIRGGSFFDDAAGCRATARDHFHPVSHYNNFGFRVARSA